MNEARSVSVPQGAKRALVFALGLSAASGCDAFAEPAEDEQQPTVVPAYGAVVTPAPDAAPLPTVSTPRASTSAPIEMTPTATAAPTPTQSQILPPYGATVAPNTARPIVTAPEPTGIEAGAGGGPDAGSASDAGAQAEAGANADAAAVAHDAAAGGAGSNGVEPDAATDEMDSENSTGGAMNMPGPQPPYGAPPAPAYGAPPLPG